MTDGFERPAADNVGEIELERFTIRVGGRDLLRDFSGILDGEGLTVIVGPSGAGKSLWIRAVAGLIPPDDPAIEVSGDVRIGSKQSPKIGVVFQSYAVLDELSPIQNVQLAVDHASSSRSAGELLDQLGVPADCPTAALSGGQKQRLGIARTIASSPDFILYDEPTSGLDGTTGAKVAELIRQTHERSGIPGVIVTHDYAAVLPVADRVLTFDVQRATLREVPRSQWSTIADSFETDPSTIAASSPTTSSPTTSPPTTSTPMASPTQPRAAWVAAMGRTVRHMFAAAAAIALPLPTTRWMGRFWWDHLRLVGGPSAVAYVVAAGSIVGFVAVYFTFEFLPYKRTTGPLLIDDLIAAIGFALYRILIPILVTVLIAARSGAALAASIGVKRYGGQIDAMQTLGVDPRRHLGAMSNAAMILTTPILVIIAYHAAAWVAAATFLTLHRDVEPVFWRWHFGRGLLEGNPTLWVVAKCVTCGIVIAGVAYFQGNSPKGSAAEVSRSITRTILWSTLLVLSVHFGFALAEF